MSSRSTEETKGLTGRTVVYDEDGKPCRACNTLEDFRFVTGKVTTSKIAAAGKPAKTMPEESLIPGSRSYERTNPPDVNELGKSTWNFLHSMTAQYPKEPSPVQKTEMSNFLHLFSRVYPCNWCAKDFEKYLKENAPKVNSREELGRWMCEAHNSVNVKLRKEKFNCDFWEKRWREGWEE
ncbi:hypothetical protein TPHA_0F00990 [Tetrapisispora phaffii CBS 4417]|uniref:Sulfhydryl oxidase n=1 Tax=Tetrapisispora phaffii (strain ATCC 24235 / CBS 4417 / NBRC 1672 / NRRL Y-8282 / UCD 70-5) TaxID=1071381 RepID=G8BV03_TETPH|nr:hypothetical protein TPHA_0F00990 [Tetrapisispora phaffii CBS 4417]CCE63585.1 hypothetical protein TPHA_0F00990 [Tetrapisispora phaffii CBS 4417]